jgi:DNA polymerase-3 subunit delta'
VAIINNAEQLNSSSSNALLKTLEEPSPSTIIILIAGSGKILPTIVSRCQVLNFSPLTQAQLREFAQAAKLEINQAMLNLSFGRLAKLKRLAEDEDFFNSESAIVSDYQKASAAPLAEKFLSISQLAELEPEELNQRLRLWLYWQLGQLGKAPQDYGKVQALTESLAGLQMNKNKKLVLQSLMLKI